MSEQTHSAVERPAGTASNEAVAGKSGFSFALTQWLLHKRHFVVFVLLAVIGSGLIAYQSLPLEAFPDVANMQARVITQVPGKAPEEVERLATIPIEKEASGIPHSKPLRSISIFGLSVVTMVFDDAADPYTARQQVLERIFHADLPEGLDPQLDPNASPVGEVFRYTVEGKYWSPMDRKEVQDWLLNRLFKSIDGIVDSTGFGGPTKIFLVELDPGRLRAFGLSHAQVAQAIARSNGSTGGSYIVSNDQRYMVRGLGLLKNVAGLANVAIASSRDGTPIKLRDVAKVQVSSAVRKGQVGLNEDDDVVEGILMMRRGDNPSRLINSLNDVWNEIQEQLPEGMRMVPLYDRTALIRQTVDTISHNVAEGVVLVVAILMLFLFQVRSALICSLVIPTALLESCIVLKLLNIPANLLSLGAIDFGIIVDGAVVMVENINKRLASDKSLGGDELRLTICDAAADVAKPIIFATTIIAMTFLPILSFEHVEGRLFKPLAVMMNLNLTIAVLCTLLAVPVISFLVFAGNPPKNRESPLVVWLEKVYGRLIPIVQQHAVLVVTAFAGLCLSAVMLVPLLGAEFIPELEEGIWQRAICASACPSSKSISRNVRKSSASISVSVLKRSVTRAPTSWLLIVASTCPGLTLSPREVNTDVILPVIGALTRVTALAFGCNCPVALITTSSGLTRARANFSSRRSRLSDGICTCVVPADKSREEPKPVRSMCAAGASIWQADSEATRAADRKADLIAETLVL